MVLNLMLTARYLKVQLKPLKLQAKIEVFSLVKGSHSIESKPVNTDIKVNLCRQAQAARSLVTGHQLSNATTG